MYNSGDVILAGIPFVDENKIKKRPALVLFEEYSNIVVAGITSNLTMDGIKLTKEDGVIKDSIIKLNYIFTIESDAVIKILFHLDETKKKLVYEELLIKIKPLK